MLRKSHVRPFLRKEGGRIRVEFLEDPGDGRLVAFLDRLCRLVGRLEGRPRGKVREALARQERRVRDARRLAGVSKSLLDRCDFRPPPGADRAPDVRAALFRARGELWPPVPGDLREPYRRAAAELDLDPDDVARFLYADGPAARVLARAPGLDGEELLRAYDLDLARGVLLEAVEVRVTADGAWGDVFRAVKLARLMYRIESPAEAGSRSYRLHLTGPASPFLARPQRYGHRFARVVPALARAPGWSLEARVLHEGGVLDYRMDASTLPFTLRGSPLDRARYDSSWERSLAREFEEKIGRDRDGWTLHREATPVSLGAGELFLPDFTFRHRDGREALVEIVGFWTPDYLERKLRKVAAAGLDHLVLVVYEGLAAGGGAGAAASGGGAGAAAVVGFVRKPRIGPVMEAVERVAR